MAATYFHDHIEEVAVWEEFGVASEPETPGLNFLEEPWQAVHLPPADCHDLIDISQKIKKHCTTKFSIKLLENIAESVLENLKFIQNHS